LAQAYRRSLRVTAPKSREFSTFWLAEGSKKQIFNKTGVPELPSRLQGAFNQRMLISVNLHCQVRQDDNGGCFYISPFFT